MVKFILQRLLYCILVFDTEIMIFAEISDDVFSLKDRIKENSPRKEILIVNRYCSTHPLIL